MKDPLKKFRLAAYLVAILLGVVGLMNPDGAGLIVGIGVIGAAILLTLAFAIWSVIQNPKGAAIPIGVIVSVVAIVLVVAMATPGQEVWGLDEGTEKVIAGKAQFKFVTGALVLFGVVGSATVLSMIYSEVRSMFK